MPSAIPGKWERPCQELFWPALVLRRPWGNLRERAIRHNHSTVWQRWSRNGRLLLQFSLKGVVSQVWVCCEGGASLHLGNTPRMKLSSLP